MNTKNNNVESSMRDWSAGERRKFLRSIPAPKRHQEAFLAQGLSVRGLCGTDVSILDRRSVKAQLAGRGDFRPAWWELNRRLHEFFRPGDSLEQAMFSFHKRHHAVTFGLATLVHEYWEMVHLILTSGGRAGARRAAENIQRMSRGEG